MRDLSINHDAMFNVGNKHIDTGIPQTQRKAAVDCVRCSTNRGGFGLVCTHDDLKDPPHEPNGDQPLISHIQKFRKQLADGRLCLGTGISMNDPAVAEALAPVVDFLWIDMEHNPMGIETMMGHLIAARAGGAPVLVRGTEFGRTVSQTRAGFRFRGNHRAPSSDRG